MTVSTYNPADHVNCDTHAPNSSTVADKTAMDTSTITNKDDIVHLMPTLTDLKKPHSDQEFIEKAMAEERSNHKNLIASSRDELPSVLVNGVMIDRTAIAQELQYHPAENKEDAVFLATQALVVRELLRLAVLSDSSLGESAWDEDEEKAISSLIDKNVKATTPNNAICERYYEQNITDFMTDPIMSARHILLACLPEDGDERLKLKKTAYDLIEQINADSNSTAALIELARQHSACPSKEQGGDLGVISKGQTVPEFESTLFKLETGIAPSPIESRYGFHIVEVLNKQPGIQMNYEQVSAAIANKLSQQAFHQSLCDYLFTLTDEAEIQGIEMVLAQENIYRG
ncbi:possible peptidyl-prolyl cis-trans isomerase [Psychrobacter arcticus 273-4]|uniref:peptidylprolyl isomerase n=1 Tax=Psychrobacter arcticus (strain DSM 17307 / VKM B-2377 / 273-4) TaxID=259536 RepID=Q4FU39_PSYA2|nr:peptidylprolyl isomerase [Psychrobacter arcticus]AAZ18469.1 possible peptidyl-prolyl cis-trans isomerase [Psychrobacter arcticus 273-4]